MPSLEDIKRQISALDDFEKITVRKEIKELPGILWDDERIISVISGFYNKGTGLLILTASRMIFIDKGILGGTKVEDFQLNQVSSIQYETGMMFGKITIYTSSNKATIEQVEKRLAKRFTEVARRNISGKGIERLNETHESETQKSTSNSTKLSELERLAELYDKGYISDEEFSKAKRELFP